MTRKFVLPINIFLLYVSCISDTEKKPVMFTETRKLNESIVTVIVYLFAR